MRGELSKPNFLGIGAQKCASTWLYDILSDHPEACLSNTKELDFFSNFYDFGYQWYERQFEPNASARVMGEVSPSYFHHTTAPQRVRDYAPNMQLIVFLREPVQRALSNHKHEVRIGHFSGTDLSFEKGLQNNPQYIEQGLYATHLERWLRYFDRQQLLVVLFDDVVADGSAVARRIYEFLRIDVQHVPAALSQRSNESYVNRSAKLEASKNFVRSILRGLRLGWLWDRLGKAGLQKAYRAVNRLEPDNVIPPLQPQTRQQLDNLFADEISRLETLTDLNLDRWRAGDEG
jgi:hypothetical protein